MECGIISRNHTLQKKLEGRNQRRPSRHKRLSFDSSLILSPFFALKETSLLTKENLQRHSQPSLNFLPVYPSFSWHQVFTTWPCLDPDIYLTAIQRFQERRLVWHAIRMVSHCVAQSVNLRTSAI